MNVDLNGLRMQIGSAFNKVAETELSYEQTGPMWKLRTLIGALLACYDPDGDFDDLSDKCELYEIKEKGEVGK